MSAASSLVAIVSQLDPVLVAYGFAFQPDQQGISSGGPFASGFLVRGSVRIGLIVRSASLGLPVYECSGHNAGHDAIVRLLGREADAQLRWDDERWVVYARDGGDPVAALLADLVGFVLPFVVESPAAFAELIAADQAARLRKLSCPGPG